MLLANDAACITSHIATLSLVVLSNLGLPLPQVVSVGSFHVYSSVKPFGTKIFT